MPKEGIVSSLNSLEERLTLIQQKQDEEGRNQLIRDYIPFVIKIVSSQMNRYIETENSDEFSIGMIAFNEAIEKYVPGKGYFLSFAELVIRNRVKDHLRKEKCRNREVQFDEGLEDSGLLKDSHQSPQEESHILREEIERYREELKLFQITLEDLVRQTPKHEDTRQNAVRLSQKIGTDPPLVEALYRKKKLPTQRIIERYHTTKKILKRSRVFIISLIIIFTGDFDQLRSWVNNSLRR